MIPAIYYASRMISAQKNRMFVKSHYEKIRKVYSIWIQMNVGEEKANTITEYSIAEKNVVGAVKETKRDYDLLTVIMLGLGNADEATDKPILRLLDVLLSAETKPEEKKEVLEEDFDIPMTEVIREETNFMSNLGRGLVEKTYAEAYEEATLKTQLNGVLNLIKSLKLSVEEAINALGVPDENRQPLLDMVNKELAVK